MDIESLEEACENLKRYREQFVEANKKLEEMSITGNFNYNLLLTKVDPSMQKISDTKIGIQEREMLGLSLIINYSSIILENQIKEFTQGELTKYLENLNKISRRMSKNYPIIKGFMKELTKNM